MSTCDKNSNSIPFKSFSTNYWETKERINIDYFLKNFTRDEIHQIYEFCKIIADVLTLPANSMITINGEERYVSTVQEVYFELDERHIETVLAEWNKLTYKINRPKTYIRTALYNSYFQLESAMANEINSKE